MDGFLLLLFGWPVGGEISPSALEDSFCLDDFRLHPFMSRTLHGPNDNDFDFPKAEKARVEVEVEQKKLQG